MSCFVCIVLCPDIILVFLLLPVPSGLFVLFTLLVMLFFPFLFHVPEFSSVLSKSLVIVFFFAFPIEFPVQVLCFCSCYFREYRFYHRQISFFLRLVHLTPWCCSLIFVQIIRLFFPMISWLFSNLGFLAIIISFSFQTLGFLISLLSSFSSLLEFILCVLGVWCFPCYYFVVLFLLECSCFSVFGA